MHIALWIIVAIRFGDGACKVLHMPQSRNLEHGPVIGAVNEGRRGISLSQHGVVIMGGDIQPIVQHPQPAELLC